MKKTLIAIAAIFTLLLPAQLRAQAPASNDQNTTLSLDIARNIMLGISGLADGFKKYKGDSLKKEGGNTYYAVKDLSLGTDLQYVIVKPDGTSILAAVYQAKDKDDKTAMALPFAAFTGGITTLTNGSKDIAVIQDESVEKDELKYFLKVGTYKVASFSWDTKRNEATMLIVIQ